jgi:pantoate--beta-alanine ligase
MNVVETIPEMQALSTEWRRAGLKVGVVPTMGALHPGHMSLIDVIKPHVDRIILTLFVNPTQFGKNEDLDKYPRTFEADKAACLKNGVAAIFFPSNDEMYQNGSSTWVTEDSVSQGYCGSARPEHFRGVTTVVAKLFNATLPDVAVFGEKDYQQLQVLKRMTHDLNFPIKVLGAPIFREASGLAMSSRNEYLNPEVRNSAAMIFKSMNEASDKVKSKIFSFADAKEYITAQITAAGGKVEYVEFVDRETLLPLNNSDTKVRCLVAAKFSPARLIDNIDFA